MTDEHHTQVLLEMSQADEAGGPGQAAPFCAESVIYITAFQKKVFGA